jgi:hypothetical protein
MKSALFFLFTVFISIACFEAALDAGHPLLLYAIGFGIWLPFIWYCSRRNRRNGERSRRERLFREYMRNSRR